MHGQMNIDRNWKDIFSVQSEVAQTISKELHTIITPSEKELIKKVPTANMAAYDCTSMQTVIKRLSENQKCKFLSNSSCFFYKAALEIDSTFAKAYTGLANAYYNRYQWENYLKENYLDTCLILANKALLLTINSMKHII